ncbi:MAG: hypothetical protein CXT75_10550 [Methanobacteriota archaeon]|jgi:hypothetical protein|nr:MAG: hypothetical protein CXT75_10550 [Euryarchaeota archaeon]
MNKIVIGTLILGIILLIVGLVQIRSLGDDFENTLEAGILYQGADGEMELKQNQSEMGIVVHIKSTYAVKSSGGFNNNHGNNTWNLTEDDCNLVETFTLTHNEDNTQAFYPDCYYIEDDGSSAGDGWIAVGWLCMKEYNKDNRTWREDTVCPDGTYTWNTGGETVMAYDLDLLIQGLFALLGTLASSVGACCCGVVVLIIGIILAFTLQDNQNQTFDTSTTHPLTNNRDDGFTNYEKKGWDKQEDYIRKDKDEEDIPEKSEKIVPENEEKKRSGEYESPPPPEN